MAEEAGKTAVDVPKDNASISGAVDSNKATIATEPQLEQFARTPTDERHLDEPLRGVLAETATTGRIRYKWPLVRPLVEFALEQVSNQWRIFLQLIDLPTRKCYTVPQLCLHCATMQVSWP